MLSRPSGLVEFPSVGLYYIILQKIQCKTCCILLKNCNPSVRIRVCVEIMETPRMNPPGIGRAAWFSHIQGGEESECHLVFHFKDPIFAAYDSKVMGAAPPLLI